MTRHEFLAALHELLRPKVYLEVGVQHGTSLALAVHSDRAIGVDPEPSLLLQHERHGQEVYAVTSDTFFSEHFEVIPKQIDLAFIDGSHLFEDALRDFMNIEQYCGPRSVVVFDDMLPYNSAIAARVQPPGDWTGDVWKVWSILEDYRGDLEIFAVDTFPTGTLVVFGFPGDQDKRNNLIAKYDSIVAEDCLYEDVPGYVLRRDNALQPEAALALIKENVCASPSPEGPASSGKPPSTEPGK
jgi:hypothetical protein